MFAFFSDSAIFGLPLGLPVGTYFLASRSSSVRTLALPACFLTLG